MRQFREATCVAVGCIVSYPGNIRIITTVKLRGKIVYSCIIDPNLYAFTVAIFRKYLVAF